MTNLSKLKAERKRLQEAEREARDTGYVSYAEHLRDCEIPKIERLIKGVEINLEGKNDQKN